MDSGEASNCLFRFLKRIGLDFFLIFLVWFYPVYVFLILLGTNSSRWDCRDCLANLHGIQAIEHVMMHELYHGFTARFMR